MERNRGRLAGIAMALILGLGLFSSLSGLFGPGGRALTSRFTLAEWADGRASAALSRHLNGTLIGGEALAQTARAANWLLLGDLGNQVRQGCAGWLFLREELDLHANADAARAQRAVMVAAVRDRLHERGIGLTVVVVPDKSRVVAAERCNLRRPAALQPRLADFMAALKAAGVAQLDLLPILEQTPASYLRSDTHWSEAGTRAVAHALAETLRARDEAPPPGPDVAIETSPPAERLGDLIHLAGLDALPAPFRPAGDLIAVSRITQPQAIADDLLGDMTGPAVAVVGSSFSRNSNFIGFLSAAMAAPVADLAQDGAGFAGAAEAYFQDAAFTATPPRSIIWEFPERVLDNPLSEREKAWAVRLAAGSL